MTEEFLKTRRATKRKPSLIETDDEKEHGHKTFIDFLEQKKTKGILAILQGKQFLLTDSLEQYVFFEGESVRKKTL